MEQIYYLINDIKFLEKKITSLQLIMVETKEKISFFAA